MCLGVFFRQQHRKVAIGDFSVWIATSDSPYILYCGPHSNATSRDRAAIESECAHEFGGAARANEPALERLLSRQGARPIAASATERVSHLCSTETETQLASTPAARASSRFGIQAPALELSRSERPGGGLISGPDGAMDRRVCLPHSATAAFEAQYAPAYAVIIAALTEPMTTMTVHAPARIRSRTGLTPPTSAPKTAPRLQGQIAPHTARNRACVHVGAGASIRASARRAVCAWLRVCQCVCVRVRVCVSTRACGCVCVCVLPGKGPSAPASSGGGA